MDIISNRLGSVDIVARLKQPYLLDMAQDEPPPLAGLFMVIFDQKVGYVRNPMLDLPGC